MDIQLLRAYGGPLIVSVTLCLIILPHLMKSWYTTSCIVFCLGGILLCWHDFSHGCQEYFRSSVRGYIQGVSLDDILQSIHDAEATIVGATVTAFLGQMALYGLPCSTEQKIRLFQSGLQVADSSEARRILLEPGGWSCLLPESAQKWIFASTRSQHHPRLRVELLTPDLDLRSHNSTTSSDVSELYEAEKDRIKNKKFVDTVSSLIGVKIDAEQQSSSVLIPPETNSEPLQETSNTDPNITPPLPLEALGSVLKEIFMETLVRHFSVFSDTNRSISSSNSSNRILEVVGAAASVLLLGQLGWSRRARQMVWSFCAGTTTASIATIWTISMASLVAKHHVHLLQLGRNSSTLVLVQSILKTVLEKSRNSKLSRTIAALVMMLLWPRRRKNTTSCC